jgi:predicted Rossmann-fold nucleotide-binding protein
MPPNVTGSGSPNRFVLVIGTGWTGSATRRAARMIGTTLADAGLGLVTGNSTGVDRWVADAYCGERTGRGEPVAGAFLQITLGGLRFFRRGGAPWPGYNAPAECRIRTRTVEDWKREALAHSHAAVMVGGGRGALDIARRFIERGLPVFPLPFMGGLTGNSDFVFREILKTWDSHPVPGLRRSQFLQLAEPWVSGTGPLANLLRGTLADTPDMFVSYRRSDAPAAAGRIAHDLEEHFGQRCVFLDIQDIAPSRAWDHSIEDAIDGCKAGVIVIGRNWLAADPVDGTPRLSRDDDVLRSEITRLIARKKAVFPVLVEGAALPGASDLPEDLRPLLRLQAASIDNAGWDVTMATLVSEIEQVIRFRETAGRRMPR